MAHRHTKQYLSTEVSVHKLELEFVHRFLEFDEALDELFYYLDHLPESLRPLAQYQKARIQATFATTLQAARLAGPQVRKSGK